MLVTGELLIDQLSETYASPACKIGRMVENGEIVRLKRDLYETDVHVAPYLVANDLYGPSYISYEFALSWHEIIPEFVRVVTSATCNKHRNKKFTNSLGSFSYSDVPEAVFKEGVDTLIQDNREYRMASPVKAVCDKLYKMPPIRSPLELESLMFDDLRFDEESILSMDAKTVRKYAGLYHCTTVNTFAGYLEEYV